MERIRATGVHTRPPISLDGIRWLPASSLRSGPRFADDSCVSWAAATLAVASIAVGVLATSMAETLRSLSAFEDHGLYKLLGTIRYPGGTHAV